MKPTVVAYVPSPHRGYVELFKAYEGGMLYILGMRLASEFPSLTRHLPANKPEQVAVMVESLNIFGRIKILRPDNILEVRKVPHIIMPDEDVSHALAEKYFAGQSVHFDGAWRLRWDWGSVQHKRQPQGQQIISRLEFDREMMGQAFKAAERSSDWWRQIGALLVKDGKVMLVAFNKHFPSEQSPYLYGDPRSLFEAGQSIEMSSALHAEAGIVSAAADRGISTRGCDLYVTTFPCPGCAYLCANSGLRRVFYVEGYSLIEGADALRSRNIEIIRVELENPPSS